MLISLLILLVERIGLLIALAFVLTRIPAFRRLMQGNIRPADQVWLGIVFGLVGILGTYTGVVVRPEGVDPSTTVGTSILPEEAIANSRAVPVIVAGLLGGPATGILAGTLAGGHRLLIGGFTGPACALATFTQGVVSGLIRLVPGRTHGSVSPGRAFLVTVTLEIVQMVMILLVAKPPEAAIALVRLIAVPMVVANSLGVAFFLTSARVILDAEAAREADAASKALAIATQTLPMLEQGLTPESALKAARLIHSVTGVSAVALTDVERILAHVGVGDDHHRPGERLLTAATRRAIREDRIELATDPAAIECSHPRCPLQGVVVVPLHEGNQVVGTLLPQASIVKRLWVAIPLLVVGFGLTLINFNFLWRYFAWANQTMAMIALWVGAMSLVKCGKPHWVCSVPATFMTAVSFTYILMAPEGFRLPAAIGYPLGLAITVAIALLFAIRVRPTFGTLAPESGDD
ncbi:MAG TPA: LytS/YhcK type 5TM receptor domain-containing protein [Symbiobacteriaceae bacterium]